MIFFLIVMCSNIFGQITTTKVAEKTVLNEIAIYDSTENFLTEDVYRYKGQIIYIRELSKSLRKYGYSNFFSKISKSNSSFKKTKYKKLADRYFTVLDVISDPNDNFKQKYYLKLQDNNNNEIIYYLHNTRYELGFPLIVVGYFEKMKNNIGKKFFLRGTRWGYSMKDMNTGELINYQSINNFIWECIDVSIEEENYQLSLILKNENGNIIPFFTKYINNSKYIISKDKADEVIEKYGDNVWSTILNGNVAIGFTEELVLLSWGKPDKINRASYGDQWVYENQYLYFENGKLKSFN